MKGVMTQWCYPQGQRRSMCPSGNHSRRGVRSCPEPGEPKQNRTTKTNGETTAMVRVGCKGKHIFFGVESLEPLLIARRRRKNNNWRRGSASLPMLSADRDPIAGDDGDSVENPDEDRDGDADVDVDADADDSDCCAAHSAAYRRSSLTLYKGAKCRK